MAALAALSFILIVNDPIVSVTTLSGPFSPEDGRKPVLSFLSKVRRRRKRLRGD